MATGVTTGTIQTRTVRIDSNLSDKTGYAVSLDATDFPVVNLLAAATSVPFVLLEGADGSATATTGTIVTAGRTQVKLGGTVAPGDKLTATTNGVWIKTTTAGNNFGAISEEVGASGDFISVLVAQGMVAAGA